MEPADETDYRKSAKEALRAAAQNTKILARKMAINTKKPLLLCQKTHIL